jgi:hypothetical protein
LDKYNEASKDLIAVITAAIQAMMEDNTKIVVKSIRRTSNGPSNWVLSGWLKK